jgi:hypothetical protein
LLGVYRDAVFAGEAVPTGVVIEIEAALVHEDELRGVRAAFGLLAAVALALSVRVDRHMVEGFRGCVLHGLISLF